MPTVFDPTQMMQQLGTPPAGATVGPPGTTVPGAATPPPGSPAGAAPVTPAGPAPTMQDLYKAMALMQQQPRPQESGGLRPIVAGNADLARSLFPTQGPQVQAPGMLGQYLQPVGRGGR